MRQEGWGAGTPRVMPPLREEQRPGDAQAATELPTQGDAVTTGIGDPEYINRQLMEILKPPPDVDYLAVRAAGEGWGCRGQQGL